MRTTSRIERVRLLLMAERYKVQLGQAIQRRRESLGLTQKQLASMTHHKEGQTVSRWERGENVPADLDVVATALQWTLAEMVAGIEAPNRRIARKLGLVTPEGTPDLSLPQDDRLDQINAKLDQILELLTGGPLTGEEDEDALALSALFARLIAEAAERQKAVPDESASAPAA